VIIFAGIIAAPLSHIAYYFNIASIRSIFKPLDLILTDKKFYKIIQVFSGA